MKTIILSITLSVFFLTACGQSKETRNLSSFSSISVGEAIKVYLEKGSSEKAVLEVKGTDMDNVITKVSGDHLKIHMDNGNWRNVDVTIWVTYRELDAIGISSAAKLTAKEPIKSESMEIDVSSAANGEIALNAGSLEIDISSAANLTLYGNVNSMEVDISSAGTLKAYELDCKEAEIDVSSAGSAKVNVTERIDAGASSGGSIRYKGNPDKIIANSSSGGSVKKSN
ncbi:head GIN domain-containing protein [Bacteroidota bacterium]